MKFNFEYEINPVSVNHYWSIRCSNNRKPIVTKTKTGTEYQQFIKWATLNQLKKVNKSFKCIEFPLIKRREKVFLYIEYIYSKKPKDIDNILKALIDAFEGVYFENDSQIVELYVRKRKGKNNKIKVQFGVFTDDKEN